MPKKNKTLRLILGDQLNLQHPWYQEKSSEVIYLMAEMHQESEYVTHHIQKIIGFFASMRALADALSRMGHQVIYIRITDKDAKLRLEEIIDKQIAETGANRFEYQLPDEWRLDQQLQQFCEHAKVECATSDTYHFLSERMELRKLFPKGKNPLMETFYRMMRKRYGLLMEGPSKPEGGKWNYDSENRKNYAGKDPVPEIPALKNDC
ncbi:MAG: cryptochrome/photolyase family protein, partial [Bacteroidota bacterium]